MRKIIIRVHLTKWYLLPTKTLQYSGCANCDWKDYTFSCLTLQIN